jgi:hypothetical protein
MAFVAAATYVGTTVGLGGLAATIGGGALIGAGVGGLYSAITGDGNILNSMLTGGLIGGAAGGIGGTIAPQTAGIAPSTAAVPTANVATGTPALTGVNTPAGAALANASKDPIMAANAMQGMTATEIAAASKPIGGAAGLTGNQMLGYGLAGTAALSLLGSRQKGAGAGTMPDPGMIRPYEYASTQTPATGQYPAPYATAQYGETGLPILDTRERNYFDQSFAAMQPYSAKTGTVNPNLKPAEPVMVASGGQIDDELGGDYSAMGMNQGNMQKGLFGLGFANGGDIDDERQKLIMKNIKSSSTKELEKIMKQMDEQEFLRRNMPQYAEAMRPSISGMVEEAQYGDRMTQAYGGTPKDVMVMPTTINPQAGEYGGIASIGQQIDPDTRLRMMANVYRTPYDRTSLDAVRRVGAGIDRRIGKDANLSAFYEQDPMGRSKMGGARFTQRFDHGGTVKNYALGGLTLIENMIRQAEQGQLPKYQFNQGTQQYSMVGQPVSGTLGGYRFDPTTNRYETQSMSSGGMSNLGGYSDGGRMLKGPGDGMSDSIPASISGKQPARLADGEFVVPADVVSHLGNGSTDAGAKRLYAMMDKVRKARTGTKKQGKEIKAEKFLPA